MKNLVTTLGPNQVKAIANILTREDEIQRSVSYRFEDDQLILEIAKQIPIKNRLTNTYARYYISDYFIEPESYVISNDIKKQYRKLMFNYFGKQYAMNYLINY